jgi:hypothetical protein
LVYLEAFVPEDGECLYDLTQPLARTDASDRLVPPNPIPPDTDPADAAWIAARRHPQPIETFRSPLRLTAGALTVARSYLYCLRAAPGDVFGPFAARARQDPDWRYFELDASHSPHITAPEALRDVLVNFESVH